MHPRNASRSWSSVLIRREVESDIQNVLRWAGLWNTGLAEVKVADFIIYNLLYTVPVFKFDWTTSFPRVLIFNIYGYTLPAAVKIFSKTALKLIYPTVSCKIKHFSNYTILLFLFIRDEIHVKQKQGHDFIFVVCVTNSRSQQSSDSHVRTERKSASPPIFPHREAVRTERRTVFPTQKTELEQAAVSFQAALFCIETFSSSIKGEVERADRFQMH